MFGSNKFIIIGVKVFLLLTLVSLILDYILAFGRNKKFKPYKMLYKKKIDKMQIFLFLYGLFMEINFINRCIKLNNFNEIIISGDVLFSVVPLLAICISTFTYAATDKGIAILFWGKPSTFIPWENIKGYELNSKSLKIAFTVKDKMRISSLIRLSKTDKEEFAKLLDKYMTTQATNVNSL